MPSNPVFWDDDDTPNGRAGLLSALRLGELSQDNEVSEVIDQALREVRSGIYSRLGPTRVAEILALVWEENPTDEDGILRQKASSAEYIWMRIVLLRRLPVSFMDTSHGQRTSWNEDGLSSTREDQLKEQIDQLEQELETLLSDLDSGLLEPPSSLKVSTISPATTFVAGESVFSSLKGTLDA